MDEVNEPREKEDEGKFYVTLQRSFIIVDVLFF